MAITGQGPAEFIRIIRIKRGKALLETSQMQVTEIAYAVGFTTVKMMSVWQRDTGNVTSGIKFFTFHSSLFT